MNITQNENASSGVFSYLNQTAYSLVPDTVAFSSLINYPYRVGLSILRATQLQYEQAISSEDLVPSLNSVIDTIGYFFSSYAVASLLTALILNRFVIMASLRSNTARVSLPVWSRFLLHLSAIIPLVYNVIQTLCQIRWLNVFPAVDLSFYLARTFTIFAWSHCVETFVTTTTNSKPLEESDYTIFELSVQFYYLSQRDSIIRLGAVEYLPDCLMALLSRILIHVVEIFNVRKMRLLASTILNSFNIVFLLYSIKEYGLDSIPVSTRYRHFPKIFSLFLILISVLSYFLACLVRKNPFGSQEYDTTELQFYSFMHNWWNHLNCTGEEEFSHVVNKMALLLCNGNESLNKGIHREFPSLNIPAGIHRSYMISGYLNKVATIPEDLKGNALTGRKPNQKISAPAFVSKIKVTYQLLKAGFSFFVKRKWNSKNPKDTAPEVFRTELQSKDFNRFVTEKNYAKFLTKPATNEKDEDETSLLPEEDYSEDYRPDTGDLEEDSDVDITSIDGDSGDVGEELPGIVPPNDMGWFMSMWSILKLETEKGYRLTRSQYATSNAQAVLAEVILERTGSLHPSQNTSGNKILDEDDYGEDSSLSCVVCKINPRNIVLWPCTCFALCEDCRISLGLRGFNSCVCCRSEIHGYSRLNNV